MNVSVIGLGKLGLPLACLHAEFNRVFGIDLNKQTVETIQEGNCLITETELEPLLKQVIDSGSLTVHDNYEPIGESDAAIVLVPTPSLDNGAFTNRYVAEACRSIGENIPKDKDWFLVVISSTVMPGSCDGPIRLALEESSGRVVGETLGLVFSPEFIALGSVLEDMRYPDMILIGESDSRAGDEYMSLALHVAIDSTPFPPVRRMSLVNAELAKLSVNSYVTMKISFANMLSQLCNKIPGGDAFTVTKAIGLDRRIGHKYLNPGTSYAGPCFPRDQRAFRTLSAAFGVPAPLAIATDLVNEEQRKQLIGFVLQSGRPHVGIVGLSYKPGTAVVNESFGFELMETLGKEGFVVSVHDPMVDWSLYRPTFPYVKWEKFWAGCVGNDIITVIANNDESFRSGFPELLESTERQSGLILDPWDLLPRGPWDDTNIIRFGVSL